MQPGKPKEHLQVLRHSISILYIAGMSFRGCSVTLLSALPAGIL